MVEFVRLTKELFVALGEGGGQVDAGVLIELELSRVDLVLCPSQPSLASLKLLFALCAMSTTPFKMVGWTQNTSVMTGAGQRHSMNTVTWTTSGRGSICIAAMIVLTSYK